MTEEQWLTSTDPQAMLAFIEPWVKRRQLRLWCTVCAFLWMPEEKWNDTYGNWKWGREDEQVLNASNPYQIAKHWAEEHSERGLMLLAGRCDFLRDIIGNPFRPYWRDGNTILTTHRRSANRDEVTTCWMVHPVNLLAWNHGTIPRLAHTIWHENRFEDMPILRDALLDAGCEDERLLGHCLEPVHVRGCWVVELLAGIGEEED